jgi:hypothetical protein
MNFNKVILVLFIVFLISCKQELKVIFPENVERTETYIQSHEYMIIIYINPGECTSCSMNQLIPWKLYGNTLNKHNTSILLVLHNTDEQKVNEILKSLEIQFPVVFDKEGKFRIANDKIFRVAHNDIFVIDKNKNVIFIGSPIANEKQWREFIKVAKLQKNK